MEDSRGNPYLVCPETITEVVPGRLFQSGNIKEWKDIASQADISVVVDVMSKGGGPPKGMPLDPSVMYIHWPLHEDYADEGKAIRYPPLRKFSALVQYLAGLLNDGERVLVHCSGGRNRSSAVIAGILMELHGMSLVEAVEKVALCRWGTWSNEALKAWFLSLWTTAKGSNGDKV